MFTTESNFNEGRKRAFTSLSETIDHCIGKVISENEFRDEWQKRLKINNQIISDGWYNPPPYGMAVLAGAIDYPSRISFESLRIEKYWTSDRIIDWTSDLFYAYCSPVHIPSGLPGDIAITLYFGKNEQVLGHFRNSHKAVKEVLNLVQEKNTSQDIFLASQSIFNNYGLKNCVVSYTDQVPLDLGHTFPQILVDTHNNKNFLTNEEKGKIRTSRQFINAKTSWHFSNELQFTIEPQLISMVDKNLPQVTYHYLIQSKNGFSICNDVDILLERFNLI
jgi:hypothetical protein